MSLYKIINEHEIKPYDGSPVKLYIANPTEEQLRILGYKELIEDEIPEYDTNSQLLEVVYSITNNDKIKKTYNLIDINNVNSISE